MMLFRAVFITAIISVAFLAQVSAWILPITRYMLDAVPEPDAESTADDNVVPVGSADAATSPATDTDIPAVIESSPVVQDDAAEPSDVPSSESVNPSPANHLAASSSDPAPPSAVTAPVSQSNGAGQVVIVGSTSVLVGTLVAGLSLTLAI